MAFLNVDFSYDDNVKRSINSAKSALSTRISDYRSVKNGLNRMSSSSGNLSTANTYIQKKINSLQNKYDRLENFRSAITTFNTNADAADRRVAHRINTETNSFYKREGIQTGILYTIGSAMGKGAEWLKGKIEDTFTAVVEWGKTTWENIKQWYEDNKHWVDVVIDVVCVVAAVAALVTAGGVVGAIIALWGLAKATADLAYDGAALYYYQTGDMERYEELSEKGLKDFMSENLGVAGEYIYYGMEVASAIYGIYKIGTSVGKIFSDYKKLYGSTSYSSWILSDGSKSAIIKSNIKTVIMKTIGLTSLDAATGQMNVTNMISVTSWTLTTMRSLITSDSPQTFLVDTIKITSSFKKLFSNIDNIFGKAAMHRLPSNPAYVVV